MHRTVNLKRFLQMLKFCDNTGQILTTFRQKKPKCVFARKQVWIEDSQKSTLPPISWVIFYKSLQWGCLLQYAQVPTSACTGITAAQKPPDGTVNPLAHRVCSSTGSDCAFSDTPAGHGYRNNSSLRGRLQAPPGDAVVADSTTHSLWNGLVAPSVTTGRSVFPCSAS